MPDYGDFRFHKKKPRGGDEGHGQREALLGNGEYNAGRNRRTGFIIQVREYHRPRQELVGME